MKQLNIFILIVFCNLLLSCTRDFLDLYPETTLNEGNYYQSQDEYISLVNGCYVPLKDNEKVTHWIISELKSDNLARQHSTIAGESTRGLIDWFLATPNNDAYSDFWNVSYKGIYGCNKAISEIESSDDKKWLNLALRERSLGEVYFLRALYYFNLVRQFGDIPLVTKVITGREAVEIKRTAVQEVYLQIIEDLQNAHDHFSKSGNVEEKGRANDAASLGLLGKVYLTIGNYKDAETVLQSVIGMGKYSLLADYGSLFNPVLKDYTETIFSVQYSEASSALSNGFIFFNAPYTSKGEITNRPNVTLPIAGSMRPTQDLLDAFEDNDQRKATAIGFWMGPDWDNVVTEIPYCAKYKPPQNAVLGWCGDNFPMLRYADILLMYAEVLNNQGKTSEAADFVLKVRQRAGLTNSLANLSQSELDELIEKERQVEFCFENQRWYDLVRRNRALEVMQKHGEREKSLKTFLVSDTYIMEPFKLLSPVPAEQILINKLTQNPGY